MDLVAYLVGIVRRQRVHLVGLLGGYHPSMKVTMDLLPVITIIQMPTVVTSSTTRQVDYNSSLMQIRSTVSTSLA